jgi:hypothetical protein
MEDRLGDLLPAQTNIVSGSDVHFELRFAATECGEDADGDELAASGIEFGAVLDITKGEGRHVVAERGADIGKGVDHRFALAAVDA